MSTTAASEPSDRSAGRIVFFLAMAVAFGVAAWFTFPRRAVVDTPRTLALTTTTSTNALSEIVLEVSHTSTQSGWISVFVSSEAPAIVKVAFSLPAVAEAKSCDGPCANPSLTLELRTPVQDVYEATTRLKYENAAVGLAWIDNGLNLSAVLPIVKIGLSKQKLSWNAQNMPQVITTLAISDASSYDWGPTPPDILGGVGVEFVQPLTSAPDGLLSTASQDPAFNVSNPAAAHHDNDFTFVAGALVGVAGGALMMALDLLTRPSDRPEGGNRPRKLLR